MSDTIEIFISYSKQDKELRDGLLAHLRPLEREGIIIWHDRQILPGTQWDDEIKARLNAADIILLLISSDFLATDYCTKVEIPEALRRHKAGEATVMPIILRSCGWNYTPLAAIQAYPEKAKPIKSWPDIDEAYTNVVDGVYRAATEIKNRRSQRQAEEQEKLHRAEQLRQQEAVRLEQEELNRRHQNEEQEKLHQAEQLRQQQEVAKRLEQENLKAQLKGNYVQLEALLEAGDWEAADQETARQMYQVMGRQQAGWLREVDIEQFPCPDLRAIDQLWVKYSNGKFGFSVQKQIWQECGSPTVCNAQWQEFGNRVGWRKGLTRKEWRFYKELTFNTFAPKGHLPVGVVGGGVFWGRLEDKEVGLFARAQTCKL